MRERRRNHIDDKYDIVFFWKQNDSDIYGRRHDMLVKYFAAHPKVARILHFDAPIAWGDLRKHLRRGPADARTHSNLIYAKTLARVFQLDRRGNVDKHAFVYNDRHGRGVFPRKEAYLEFLTKVFEQQQLWQRRTIFWVFPKCYEFPQVARCFQPDLVVADVVDDHRHWPCARRERERVEENYRDILSMSDVVFTNCSPIKESMSDLAATDIHIIPNACELLDEEQRPVQPPSCLARLERPIIGYVGNLCPTRLNIDLLNWVAQQRPSWQLVFIGSAHISPAVFELEKHPNVHFLGVIEYERVSDYIRCFDVAMIPHLDNALTRSMNPLKAYVYCSLNVPVVSTNVANICELESVIRIAGSNAEFVELVEHALCSGKSDSLDARRREILRRCSWNHRVSRMLEIIEAEWQSRRG